MKLCNRAKRIRDTYTAYADADMEGSLNRPDDSTAKTLYATSFGVRRTMVRKLNAHVMRCRECG